MQLERILQSQGFGTRRECRALVRLERVTVRGEMIDDPFVEVDTTELDFSVDGETWRYHEKSFVMLHKPAGYECSQKPKHHPAVLHCCPRRWSCATSSASAGSTKTPPACCC
jgi:16S rRNA pseudouridine516 synthase